MRLLAYSVERLKSMCRPPSLFVSKLQCEKRQCSDVLSHTYDKESQEHVLIPSPSAEVLDLQLSRGLALSDIVKELHT